METCRPLTLLFYFPITPFPPPPPKTTRYTLYCTRLTCFPHGKVEHKARFILDPALYSER